MLDDVIQADPLRHFSELVVELGGAPEAALRSAEISDSLLSGARLNLGPHQIVNALENAAAHLGYPSFGLHLASRQGGAVFGIMGIVMRNSATFGDAIRFVTQHAYAHSLSTDIQLTRRHNDPQYFLGHNIMLEGMSNQTQAIEHILLLTHFNAVEITGGRARVREVHFRHHPMSPLPLYRRYFGCDVRFDQPENGVMFSERDFLSPISAPDPIVYKTVVAFIRKQFGGVAPPMHAHVRRLLLRSVGRELCDNATVAADLGLHPKTLLRRLKAEGKTFHQIRDEVRRDLALYYLQNTTFELSEIALKLGYAEHSVFSRSCVRWFGASPSQKRQAKSPANVL